ncbi:leucine-rich repeat, immunoglobulin-like domain and transmembrane domain-containing protein 3a [Electrophorus electricus]|uniref:Ig-like domain-containing protein n=1 Tax=Electrophorus electricus TaxID=8005 RepID=A0A4W4EKQ5_ELEEL|nr:leucine-rich repeat, immunoglobulin-like domain and transmembrane domain-containing protein 3a [Electrophorus electricus]
MWHLLIAQLVLCWFGSAQAFCPSQCSCTFQTHIDGSTTRTVLCNDPDMSDVPVNVPVDTVKLRVEKTMVRHVPPEAFYYLTELRYLWMAYNAVTAVDARSFYNLKALHELRLDGNLIATFPWESLKETPSLRTLDLHNNRLTSIPAKAVAYLHSVTYLDISSNRLTTLPTDLVDIWPPFSSMLPNTSHKFILGLQDNLWYCDCQISKLIELSQTVDAAVVLMDPYLLCSGPANLAGILFQRAELDQCVKPSVMTSATKITSSIGSNVLLRCDATGYPTPSLLWSRADGSPVNTTVVQESPGAGVQWSILSLHGVQASDAGVYCCKARNVAGHAEAFITLSVAGMETTPPPPPITTSEKPDEGLEVVTEPPPPVTGTVLPSSAFPGVSASMPPVPLPSPAPGRMKPGLGGGVQRSPPSPPAGDTPAKIQQGKGPASSDEASTTSDGTFVERIKVVEETGDTAAVLWTSEGLPSDGLLSVVYFPYDAQAIKQTVETDIGQGKLLLENLLPNQVYTVCLAAKGVEYSKDQCVNFSTLEATGGHGQDMWLIIISGAACAVVLPLIMLLLYKIASLYCEESSSVSRNTGEHEDLSRETYVKFETLAMKPRAMNGQVNDIWARRQTQESERMLLYSRSSIDSQMTYKSDSSRSEYLC